MPRVFIESDLPGLPRLRAEIVTVSEVDGIYAIACSRDGIDQCPDDIEPGDTWSNFGDCVQEAIRHIGNHENRHVRAGGTQVPR